MVNVEGSGPDVQKSRFGNQGSIIHVQGLTSVAKCSRLQVPCSRFMVQCSRVNVQGSRFEAQGSGLNAPCSRVAIQSTRRNAPCPRPNVQYPRFEGHGPTFKNSRSGNQMLDIQGSMCRVQRPPFNAQCRANDSACYV